MTFTESLALVAGLLALEKRVSYRRLRNEFAMDEQTLEDVRHELITAKRLARDEKGEVLVWAGAPLPCDDARDPRPGHPEAAEHDAGAGASPASVGEVARGAARTPADAERRQLTVMFCDLVDSTALSTRMDPEELRDVIGSFQDTCKSVVRRYDGFIARFMGDGVLVYFGYPQAHEDDSERAVRAGLDIVDAVPGLEPQCGEAHDLVMAVRVGIATGPVVVGDIIGEGAAEQAAVVGETPNLAARLQGVAAPNQLVISSMVRRLIGDLFELEDLGVHELKGMAEPVRAWRVRRERDIHTRFQARHTSGRPPMVGRQEELGLLLRAWEATRESHGQVVLVQGEAGIGKSRLLEALHERVSDQDFVWVEIHCSPYHTNSTLYPVVEHLKRALGWLPEDSGEARLNKLERALRAQGASLQDLVPLYADLLSLPVPGGRYAPLALNPRQQREATLDALVGWLLDDAERNTVLLVWEDLHWADPTTLELLGLYIEQSPTVPTLNIFTYRPEFSPPWPMRSHMTPITLNRMERPEVEALIALHSGGRKVPEEVVEHIVAKADGVPLFAEELTKAILESGCLLQRQGRFVVEGSLWDVSIPATLQDSLMARLDRVPQAREIAQLGAVLGREFTYDMLQLLAPMHVEALTSGLQQLVEVELLYQRGRPPRSRYIFKHALIQDAAYQSLLKRTRQQYHLRVGRLMEQRFPETVEAHPELLAHHYTNGGAALQAIAAWHKASELARSHGANQEAVTHLNNGLAVVNGLLDEQERARQELKLQFSLGGVYLQMKGHWASEVEVAFARARELCEQIVDARELVPSLFGLWRTYVVQMADVEKPREVAEQLSRLIQRHGSPVSNVVAHYALGFTALITGDFPGAKEHLQEGIRMYSPADRESAEVYRFGQDPGVACHCYLALATWILGYPQQAREHLQQSLELARRLDDPFSQAFANAIGSFVEAARGDLEATSRHADEAVRLSTMKGYPYWLSIGNVMHAWVEAAKSPTGDLVEALKEQIEAHRGLGTDLFAGGFLTWLGQVALEANEPGICLAALEQAEGLLDATGERWWENETLRLRGELSLSQGQDLRDAQRCFQRALLLARDRGAKAFELRAALSLTRLLRQRDRTQDAREQLCAPYGWFSEGFDTADLVQARTILDELDARRPVATTSRTPIP